MEHLTHLNGNRWLIVWQWINFTERLCSYRPDEFLNFVVFISSYRWPKFHWQILHVGPDGCIRGSLEPYKFMKGPCINDGKWHHIALSASSDWQCMFVDGHVVCSINFGIGHELHRCLLIGHQWCKSCNINFVPLLEPTKHDFHCLP